MALVSASRSDVRSHERTSGPLGLPLSSGAQVGTFLSMLLFPDLVDVLVGDPNLHPESKLQLLATWLVLEEDGPEADELSAIPTTAWERRRDFLSATQAWPTAARMLVGY
jgi:hypothetical protein